MRKLLSTAVLVAFAPCATLAGRAVRAPFALEQTAQATQSTTDSSTRADLFYEFTLGHMLEQEYETNGQSEIAQQSIDAYKKALALSPDSAVIRERLAEIYAKSQHIREGVQEAQDALRRDPNNIDAHRLLARIYIRSLGDMASGEVQKENLDNAIEQFQAILALQPDDSYSALWLARLYRFENQHAQAEKVLRAILEREPDNGQVNI